METSGDKEPSPVSEPRLLQIPFISGLHMRFKCEIIGTLTLKIRICD